MCFLLSTGYTLLCLPSSKPWSPPTTPGACADQSSLFLANRLAQERIKMQYVSIMDRQKNMDKSSEDYKRLDSIFYSLVKKEDSLRHEMTILAAALFPATTVPGPHFRGSDLSRPSARTSPAMVCLGVRQSTTQMLG